MHVHAYPQKKDDEKGWRTPGVAHAYHEASPQFLSLTQVANPSLLYLILVPKPLLPRPSQDQNRIPLVFLGLQRPLFLELLHPMYLRVEGFSLLHPQLPALRMILGVGWYSGPLALLLPKRYALRQFYGRNPKVQTWRYLRRADLPSHFQGFLRVLVASLLVVAVKQNPEAILCQRSGAVSRVEHMHACEVELCHANLGGFEG